MRFFDYSFGQIFRHRVNFALLDGVREDLDTVCAVANLPLYPCLASVGEWTLGMST